VFDYWNGGDINGLYGDPSLSYNPTTKQLTLIFTPGNFAASSTDGVGDPVQTTDTLHADIMITSPSLKLDSFQVTEGGSYSIIGAGGTVDDSANFDVTNLSGSDHINPVLGASTSDPLSFNLDNPISGFWTSDVSVDASSRPNYFRIELSNLLTATSNVGGTASISKLGSQIEVTMTFVPEPATIALLSLGLLTVLRRR
jgi:hypothetical protein